MFPCVCKIVFPRTFELHTDWYRVAVVFKVRRNAFVMLFRSLMAASVKHDSQNGLTTKPVTEQQFNAVQLVFFSYLD